MKASDREWFGDCQVLRLESLRVDVRERATERSHQSPLVRHIHSSDPQSPSLDKPRLPSGDQSAVEPPGPIPNPEVKRRSANGSETIGLVRVGRRQVYARLQEIGAGLFFCPGALNIGLMGPIGLISPIRTRSDLAFSRME